MLDGRIHIKNLPYEWTWEDIANWIDKGLHLPKPNWIKQFWGQDTTSSAFLHYKALYGQLETWSEIMSNHKLIPKKARKQTIADVALDQRKPNTSRPMAPWAAAPPGPNEAGPTATAAPTDSTEEPTTAAAAAPEGDRAPKRQRLLSFDEAMDEAYPDVPWLSYSGASYSKQLLWAFSNITVIDLPFFSY